MYENQTKFTPEVNRAPSSVDVDTATRRTDTRNTGTRSTDTPSTDTRNTDTDRTDPKFARESFTMRRMQAWQVGALALAAAVVVGIALYYFF